MAANIERFTKDLERLVANGNALHTGLAISTHGKQALADEYKKAGYSDRDIEIMLKGAISFGTHYQAWYSESLAVLKQLLPDRVADFVSHYEPARNRKTLDWGTYVIRDALLGSVVTSRATDQVIVDPKAALAHLQSQIAIIKAAQMRLTSSLFEMRQLVQSDVFDSEIEAARELLKNKFLRAAGAMSGVVLERHLRQVCLDHSIKMTKKNPTISDLNETLKSEGVIELPQWRHISMLGDLRNLCSHNKGKEPTTVQVEDLIDGTDKVLKTIA